MTSPRYKGSESQYVYPVPKVVLVGFASCFGCQINITNIEQHLLDVLGQIDMQYWQLTSSDPMPDSFDVAVIEGALTTVEAEKTARELRDKADIVITIGSCAATSGIPGIASADFEGRPQAVYGEGVPTIVSDIAYEPRAVKEVIDVDYEVPCCPIDPYEFVKTLHHALRGSNQYDHTKTMCGECKQNERGCFYGRKTVCMGLITKSGCGARCPNLGRPCNGCAGLSDDANLDMARNVAKKAGIEPEHFEGVLRIFNLRNPDIEAACDKADAL